MKAPHVTHEGGAILIRVELPAGPDAVRPIADLAKEWGIALPSLLSLAREAGILRKLGRQNVVRVSALLAAVDALDAPPPEPPPPREPKTTITLADVVALVRDGGRRRRK